MSTAARAAGVLLIHDGHVLLLKRSARTKDAPNTWGLPGGHVERGEGAEEAALRELREETGIVAKGTLRGLWVSRDGFACFGLQADKQLVPKLNHEHSEARWASFDALPQPLHPSLAQELTAMGTKHAYDDLVHGKSNAARSENIATEIRAGKPPAQAAAIAYKTQREARGQDTAAVDPMSARRQPVTPSAQLPYHFKQALDALHGIADDCLARDHKRK